MTIVVEGPDGAGKTTLVKQLEDVTQFKLMPRRVGQDTQALVDLKQWVEEDNSTRENWRLYDRHALISEPIYGPILRSQQKPCFTNPVWMKTELQRFYDRIPLIVYCLPPLEVVRRNVANDENNIAVADKIDSIYAAYVARACLDVAGGRHAFIYDYTIHTPRMIESMWKYYITERVHRDRTHR